MTAPTASTPGTLFIVATPIGNREDISFRALHTLQTVDIILAEDTRHSLPLLTALGIKKPLVSLHAYNETTKSEQILEALSQGTSYALISDAGTPLISDPGYPLVKRAREKAIPVVPIPGACALITALSAAGVPCDCFTFAGFLPAKQQSRRSYLTSFQNYSHTLVFYESTHRIVDSIEDIAHVFGETTTLTLAKELTKTFETFITGTPAHIKKWLLSDANHCKGEFVLIIAPQECTPDADDLEKTLTILLAELPLKQAVKLATALTQQPKNEIYQIALSLKGNK